MAFTPKSIRKKKTQHKKPGLPFPNYVVSDGDVPVVCDCIYDGTSFMVHSQEDVQILYYNGAFGRSTLTLRTPLNSRNVHYQEQPYFKKSQMASNVVIVDDYKIPINTNIGICEEGPPAQKKSKLDEIVTEDSKPNGESLPEDILNRDDGKCRILLHNGKLRPCNDGDEEEKLELLPEEAMFLTFVAGCLRVYNEDGEILGHSVLWNLLVEKNPEFPIFYSVYHYFRCKNWVPKCGHSYGGDYVLYEAGPEYYHSLYIVHVIGLPSRPKPTYMEVCALQRCASHASKYALLCEVSKPEKFVPESPKSIFELKMKELPLYRWAPHLYDK